MNVFETGATSKGTLKLEASLNDSSFSCPEINRYLESSWWGQDAETTADRTDSTSTSHLPLLTVAVRNPSNERMKLPISLLSYGYERGGERNTNILYKLGNENGALTFSLPPGVVVSGGQDMMPWVNDPDHFGTIEPGQVVVIDDSLFILDRLRMRPFSPGRYWLAVSYQNYWKEPDSDNYWIGRVNADTIWFDLLE
ncbi:hypothetical protein GF420_05310 [candidate division GN15 bacterium]|nr:hypothetical protein [candidate division GN15 bacterium]